MLGDVVAGVVVDVVVDMGGVVDVFDVVDVVDVLVDVLVLVVLVVLVVVVAGWAGVAMYGNQEICGRYRYGHG